MNSEQRLLEVGWQLWKWPRRDDRAFGAIVELLVAGASLGHDLRDPTVPSDLEHDEWTIPVTSERLPLVTYSPLDQL